MALPQGAWTPSPYVASPIFANLDNNPNGQQELIVPIAGGQLVAYKVAADGSVQVFQTYKTTPLSGGQVADIKSTPIVVNVPGRNPMVFAALGRDESHNLALEDGRIFGWDAVTGAILPGWPQDSGHATDGSSGVYGALAAGDLKGDGGREIVATSYGNFVTAFNLDGTIMWRYNSNDAIESGAVIGDIDKDGKPEVVFGSDTTTSPYFQNGGLINVLDAGGSAKYRIPIGESIRSSPVLADLQGNGYLDIVVGTGSYISQFVAPSNASRQAADAIYAVDFQGHTVPGWPYATTSDFSQLRHTIAPPAVADLLGDGNLEVVAEDSQGFVHVVGANGQPLAGWAGGIQVIPPGGSPGGDTYASPIVVTIGGQKLIVASSSVYTEAFDVHGNRVYDLTQFNFPGARLNAPAVGQFDSKGGFELAFTGNALSGTGAPSLLTVYQLPSGSSAQPWPMLRRSADSTAIAFSGNFANGFVGGAYKALFGRGASPAELASGVNGILTNQLTPFGLAATLAADPAAATTLALADTGTTSVTAWATKIDAGIGVPGVAGDSLAAMLYDLHHNVPATTVAARIVGSGGNYVATNSLAAWIRSLYRDVYFREATADEVAAALLQFDAGSTNMTAFATALVNGPQAHIQMVHGAGSIGEVNTLATTHKVKHPKQKPVHHPKPVRHPKPPKHKKTKKGGSTGGGTGGGSTGGGGTGGGGGGGVTDPTAVVVNDLLRLIPDESLGVLRTGIGNPTGGIATNPDPNLVASFVAQLQHGTPLQSILVQILTSPQYIAKADYYKGFFRSIGIRN
jgi:hypothetical protein